MANVLDRDSMIVVIDKYFAAIDGFDIDTIAECFAETGMLSCETKKAISIGHESIRQYFGRIATQSIEWSHKITGVVIDVEQGKCAIEIDYTSHRRDGLRLKSTNCNVFDFAENGYFNRVRYWTGQRLQTQATGQRLQT